MAYKNETIIDFNRKLMDLVKEAADNTEITPSEVVIALSAAIGFISGASSEDKIFGMFGLAVNSIVLSSVLASGGNITFEDEKNGSEEKTQSQLPFRALEAIAESA